MHRTHRTAWIRAALFSLVVLVLAPAVGAAEKAAVRTETIPTLADELVQLFAQEDAELAALELALDEAVDDAERLRLQRRVQAVKLRTEAAMMRVQARHARQKGRVELAERAEAHATALEKRLKALELPTARQADE